MTGSLVVECVSRRGSGLNAAGKHYQEGILNAMTYGKDAGFPSCKDPAVKKKKVRMCAVCDDLAENCCCEWESRHWIYVSS